MRPVPWKRRSATRPQRACRWSPRGGARAAAWRSQRRTWPRASARPCPTCRSWPIPGEGRRSPTPAPTPSCRNTAPCTATRWRPCSARCPTWTWSTTRSGPGPRRCSPPGWPTTSPRRPRSSPRSTTTPGPRTSRCTSSTATRVAGPCTCGPSWTSWRPRCRGTLDEASLADRRGEAAMTRRWLRAVPVLWIGVWVLLAASVPAGATTLTWSVVPSPNPGSGYNILNAVSCTSPAACTAVGYDRAGNPFHNVIESWNGAKWSVVPSPAPPGPAVGLNGVSCVSAAACVAVGSYGTSSGASKALIESWNGTSWSVAPSPHPASSSTILYGVSCISAADCTAVGSYYPLNSGQFQTFVESWNGTKWSVVPSPSPGSEYNALSAVSCVSAAACTAVGSQYETPTEQRTLAESWNGATWSVVPSPNRPNGNALDGVSC